MPFKWHGLSTANHVAPVSLGVSRINLMFFQEALSFSKSYSLYFNSKMLYTRAKSKQYIEKELKAHSHSAMRDCSII